VGLWARAEMICTGRFSVPASTSIASGIRKDNYKHLVNELYYQCDRFNLQRMKGYDGGHGGGCRVRALEISGLHTVS